MNGTKDERLSHIISSFSVFELRQIRIESHSYPRRRISLQRVGFYDTKEHGEEAMLEYIALERRNYSKWEERDYHDDCLGYFLDEEECEHPSHFLDESDDCYLVYPVGGEEGAHYHPLRYKVFPLEEKKM